MKVLDDTEPEVRRVLLDLARRATMDERLSRAFGLTDIVRRLTHGEIRREHPDASGDEMRRLLAQRLFEPGLARAVIARLDERSR